jgi:hypothetical protein
LFDSAFNTPQCAEPDSDSNERDNSAIFIPSILCQGDEPKTYSSIFVGVFYRSLLGEE